MEIVFILCVLVIFRNNVTAADTIGSFTSTFGNDIASLNFYQITLFINNLNISLIECNILKVIFVHNPTIIIDPRRLQAHSSGYLEYLTNSYQPSASILLIIFLKNLYPDEIKFALNFYIELSKKRRRPKCLVIFNNRFVEENIIKLVLEFSWQRKFLDISIINLNADNTTVNPEVFSYDPFVDIYNHRPHSLLSDVFPDKFKNLHGYILKSPFIDLPPYMMIQTANNITRYHGVAYSVIEFLASVLQFKINVTTKSHLVAATIQLQSSFNSIHFLPFPCTILESTTRKSLEIGQVFTFERFCGLITIKKDIHIKLSLKTFLSFSCSISLVFLFAFIAKYFFKLKYLYWFENFGLLLGQPVTVKLLSIIHKIMYVSIVALSMTYAPDLIGELMKSIVTYSDKKIVNYQDMVAANLQPYVHKGLFPLLYNESDKYFDIIKSKITLLNSSSTCFSLLMERKDVICFTTKRMAKWFLNENVKMYGNPLAKITNIEFPLLAESLLFEEGSPFVDKFNAIVLRMEQSRLTAAWSFKYETKLIDSREPWNEVKNEINPVQLIIMYLIGCSVSFIMFAVEVLITYCKVFQNQRVKQIKISKVK